MKRVAGIQRIDNRPAHRFTVKDTCSLQLLQLTLYRRDRCLESPGDFSGIAFLTREQEDEDALLADVA